MCLNIFKTCKNNKYEKLKEDKLRQIINEISMEWECPICFKNLEEGLYIINPFYCKHTYCFDCMKLYGILNTTKIKCYLCYKKRDKKIKIPFQKIENHKVDNINVNLIY